MKKQNLIILILVLLLVVSVSYIGIGKYFAWKQQKDLEVYQQGAQYGYEQAIVQIANIAITCQPVPLKIENQTINIIAVDCLQE